MLPFLMKLVKFALHHTLKCSKSVTIYFKHGKLNLQLTLITRTLTNLNCVMSPFTVQVTGVLLYY